MADKRNVITAEITIKTIGSSPPSRLIVPSPIKVRDLRKLVAENRHLPIENLTLILRGNVLRDTRDDFDEEELQLQLDNSDSLVVAVKPKPPAKHIHNEFDMDDDELKFQLPRSTSRWKRIIYYFLHDKLKIPEILLMAVFSVSRKLWAMIILWFIFAPVAHKWDLGPLYILGTGFVIIFLNLGRREAGDLSAYSIFNEDFRELPGTLNADRFDRDIRAGQF